MNGREADIDDNDGVKNIVCVGKKRFTTGFSECTVVLPAVGTKMNKDKEDMPTKRRRTVPMLTQRPRVSPEVIRLKTCGK